MDAAARVVPWPMRWTLYCGVMLVFPISDGGLKARWGSSMVNLVGGRRVRFTRPRADALEAVDVFVEIRPDGRPHRVEHEVDSLASR